MSKPASWPAKQAALEITALLKRHYGLNLAPTHLMEIADKIDAAITTATDSHVGVLRSLAQILTLALGENEDPDPAVVLAVAALREAGYTYES
jgi:hypothetical protein